MSVPRVQFDCRGSPGDIRPVSATASTRSTKFTERDRRALFIPAGRVIPTCNVATHEVIRRTNGSTVHSTVWVLPPPAPSFRHTCRDRPSCAGFYCSCGAGLSKLQPGLASMPAGRTQDHRDDDTAKSVPGRRIKKNQPVSEFSTVARSAVCSLAIFGKANVVYWSHSGTESVADASPKYLLRLGSPEAGRVVARSRQARQRQVCCR